MSPTDLRRDGPGERWRGAAHPSLMRALVVAGAIMLTVGVIAHALLAVPELPAYVRALAAQFSRLFYAGAEYTVWAWCSAVLMAAVAVGLGVIAALQHRAGAVSQPYAVLAAVALLLSIDETAQFHESLSVVPGRLGMPSVATFDWLVVGIPIAVVGGVVVLTVARRIDAQLRRGLTIGGALFLFGAIVLEGIGGVIARGVEGGTDSVGYLALLAVEEGLELAGVLVALGAVLAAIEVRGGGGGGAGSGAVVALRVRAGEVRSAPKAE